MKKVKIRVESAKDHKEKEKCLECIEGSYLRIKIKPQLVSLLANFCTKRDVVYTCII